MVAGFSPDWLKKQGNHKMNELITLTQAEKVHGFYEYFLNGKNVMFRLLAKESDTHSMAKENGRGFIATIRYFINYENH